MTRLNKRFTPTFEVLEERRTPATVRLIGSTVFIINPNGELDITADSGALAIIDDTMAVTIEANSVFVLGTSGGETVTFTVANTDFTGDVFFDLRGGSDVVTFQGDKTVRGDVTVLTGPGSDFVGMAVEGGADFSGNVQIIDTRGNDTLTVAAGSGDSDFKGDFTAIGFSKVDLGAGGDAGSGIDGGNDAFFGDVTLTSRSGVDSKVVIAGTTAFLGDFSLTLGDADDSVDVNNVDDSASAFGGNVHIDLGGGNNSLLSDPPGESGQTVEGNFEIVAGSGADFLDFDESDLMVRGDYLVRAGNGDNQFVLENFTVGGEFLLEAGTGNDVLENFSVLTDSVRIAFGDGANLFDDGDNLDDRFISEFTFVGGDGDNIVTLNDVDLGDVDVTVGNGANLIELDPFGVRFIEGNVNIGVGNGGNFVEVSNGVAGRLTFKGGNGGDVLDLGEGFVEGVNAKEFYLLSLHFGNADDLLIYEEGISVSGFVDGGNGKNELLEEGDGPNILSPYTIQNIITT